MVRIRAALALLALVLFPLFVIALVVAAVWVVVLLVQGEHTSVVAVKLLLIPLLGAIYWAVKDIRSLRVEPTDGPEITRAEHPRLWAEVDRLAGVVETAPPARIVVVPAVNAAVSEVGGVREMVIGLPLLGRLTVGELRSVLAHELGHFAGGDTAASARTYRWNVLLHRVRDNATGIMRWLLNGYVWFFTRVSAAASRDVERAADAFSARVAGPVTAARAMRRMVEIDLAWSILNENYVGLFEPAGARAPLGEGLRRILADNADRIGAMVDGHLVTEKQRGDDTHPPARARIAAFEAMAGGAVPPPVDGAEPATSLLTDGEGWLNLAEGDLFVQDLPLVTWDEVVARAGAQTAVLSAGEITHHLAAQGAVESRDLGATLGLLEREGAPAFGARFAPKATGEELHEAGVEVLGTLVEAAVVTAGRARHAVNWSGPWQVVGHDGEPLETTRVVDEALTTPEGPARLRGWLAAQGVDLALEATERFAVRPQLLAATTLMTGPWDGRRDGYFWTTGLLFVEPGDEATSRMPGAQSRGRQEERVGRTVALGLDAMRALPGARWIGVEDVAAITVRGLVDPKVDLRLASGEVLKIRGKADSESFEDARDALRLTFADKVVDSLD